jgi:hypothetical protein
MSALSILEFAQTLLLGGTVAKAQPGAEDPDAIQGKDPRAEGGAPTDEQLEAARSESQAGQAAAAQAGGEGGAPGGEGQEGGAGGSGDDESGGPGPGSDDEEDEGEVTKAEILASITFLAQHHKIPAEEIAKALSCCHKCGKTPCCCKSEGFSGTEGDPTESLMPVGHGVELLKRIVEGQENQNKVLDAIAGFLAEMSKKTVALSTEIGKSLEAADAAKATAEATAAQLAGIIKTAPAMPSKAQVDVSKALSDGGGAPKVTSNDLFKMALEGKHSPTQIASANRAINYGIPVNL